ncbi:MAG TPA: hypothetical protein PKY29_04465 [Ferruginibacter sp.]|nr:hypothetical protein [Ferruginibacter sp.]HRQ20542.1 hypothetical protein [Ferruginibacter sp.]
MNRNILHQFNKTAEQVKNSAEILLSSTTDWQIIKQYLTSKKHEVRLSEDQFKKLERYQFIYNQLVSGEYSDTEVVNMVQKTYGIEHYQSYDDLKHTKELFNTIININKVWEIKMQLEVNRAMQAKARDMADLKAYAMLEKNRIQLIALIPDIEEESGEMFQGHHIQPVFDPSLIGAEEVDMGELLKEINQKHNKKIKTELFTDIPHEDIPEKNPLQ